MSKAKDNIKQAILYRMVKDDHLCPYGLKAKDLLERHGYAVDDQWLTSQQQTQKFKEQHSVSTTPQVYIDDHRIGGYEALRKHLGLKVLEKGETSYRPVIMIFTMTLFLAIAMTWVTTKNVFEVRTIEWFIAISMCVLAIQKLKDVESFSTMFLNYDLLAKHWVRYGYVYPYAEAVAGLLMLAGVLPWLSGPLALTIGTIGAASVFKAVYLDKRELKCACVGGDTNVPLGAISLTENLMMMAMGSWTLFHAI